MSLLLLFNQPASGSGVTKLGATQTFGWSAVTNPSVTVTVPSGAKLAVVIASGWSIASPSSVTFTLGGVSPTVASGNLSPTTTPDANAAEHIAAWSNPTAGSQTLSLSGWSSSTESSFIAVAFFDGNVDTTTPLRDYASDQASSGTVSVTVDSTTNDYVLGLGFVESSTAGTPSGNLTLLDVSGDHGAGGGANAAYFYNLYKATSGSTTTTASYGGGSTVYPGFKLVSIAAAAGGATTHTTTGALTGQGSTVAGIAAHIAVHGTSGALTGQIGSVSGTANRFRAMSSSGALVGQGATIVGSAARAGGATTHDTSGALTGQGATLSGTAARFRAFSASGALTGQGSAIVGTAVHNVPHATSGVLAGQGSTIAGTAARTGTPVSHDTSGALVGSGAVINGSAMLGQLMQDTHDGYWHKQWEKLHKKKPKLEEVIELVQEQPEIALEEVKEAVKREYPQIDYTQIAQNAELQLYVAKQILIALELRRIADDEDDIEILMLL